MAGSQKIRQAVGVGSALIPVFPPPFLAQRAPASTDTNYPEGQVWIDQSVTPNVSYEYLGSGTWQSGGNAEATTSSFGIVQLATLSELQNGNAPAGAYVPTSNDVATVIAGIVVGAVPPATETQAGIAEIATQAETDAGADDTRIVTPLKLATYVAGGSGAGSFTDLTATGTISFTGATGTGFAITAAAASSVGTTGAGVDLTLSSASGSVPISSGEAVANAIGLQASAGGIDIDGALLVSIASSRNNAQAIEISASAGGIDISAVGTAGEDIDILATGSSVNITATENVADSIVISSSNGGIDITAAAATAGEDIDISAVGSSVNISSTENAALAIYLHADGGTSETIKIYADQGNTASSIQLTSDAGGIAVTSGYNNTDAIYLHADAGTSETIRIHSDQGTSATSIGLTSDVGGIQVLSGLNNANAIYLHADAGTSETIKIHSDQGTGVASVNVLSDVGGITISGGKTAATAINLTANGAGGGMTLLSGTGGVTLTNTGVLSLAGSGASNITIATGDLSIVDTASSIIMNAGEAVADAIDIRASNVAGGIKLTSGTGGVALTNTGVLSLAGSGASNITIATGDFTITDTASSIILNGGEAATDAIQLSPAAGGVQVTSKINSANAIYLHADAGTSETIKLHADQGTGVASLNLLSDVGGITLRSTGLASADAINLEAAAGGIDMDSVLQTNIASSQAAATAIQLTASDAAGGITSTVGTGGFNIAGDVNLTSVATKISLNGGAVTDFIGTAVLTLGTVTIANTNISAADRIFLSRIATNGSVTLGEYTYSISAGASFTVTSVILGTPASTQTADVSSFAYIIFRQT